MVLFYVKPVYLLVDDRYRETVTGSEIYRSLNKSKQASKCKILLIGDSVGLQLFDNDESSDSINSLTCNQAIGVVGQYILLNNYLNTGNKPDIVYLIYTPFSFKNNLDQVFTFHCFLKPFFNKEYSKQFTSTVVDQIDKIPFSFLRHEPYILTSNWAPNFESDDSVSFDFLSPISREYLEKIKNLCDTNNIEFHIIPTPTKMSNRKEIEDYDLCEVNDLNVQSELDFYLSNISYVQDSLFSDNVHLIHPAHCKKNVLDLMNKARKQIINKDS